MRFEVFEVKRAYGPNGWEVCREFIQAFGGLNGFVAAAQAAADLALVGRVTEIWGVQETLKGEERRLVGALSWWSFRRGAATLTYDTDYL